MYFDPNPNPDDLINAARNGKFDFVKHLLIRRVNVDYRDVSGVTALHVAIRKGHTNIVKYLIKKGADVNAKTKNGDTPLILATREDNLEIVQHLIEADAELFLKNNRGKIAFDYAIGSEAVHELLQKKSDQSFIDELNGDKKTSWNRSRLMIIGQGRAGKTATVRSLLGHVFSESTESTIGANVSKSKLSKSFDSRSLWNELQPADDENHASKFAARIINQLSAKGKRHNGDAAAQKIKPFKKPLSEKKKQELKDQKKRSGPRMTHIGLTPIAKGRRGGYRPSRNRAAQRTDILAKLSVWRGPFDIPSRFTKKFKRPFDVDWLLEAKKGPDEITISLWDFGGQEVFYTMHHIFLTKSGVYLLVFDLREFLKVESRQEALNYISFWLGSVELHAPSAPILMAGTFASEISSPQQLMDISRTLVQIGNKISAKIVKNKKDDLMFFPVDNKTGLGIDELRLNIDTAIRTDTTMQQEVSMKWILLLDEILSGTLRCSEKFHPLKEHKQEFKRDGVNLKYRCDECGRAPNANEVLHGCKECLYDMCVDCARKKYPEMEFFEEGIVPLNLIRKIAVNVGIASSSEQEVALSLFHERGMLIHLTSTDTLRNYVITKPRLLIDNLSKIIRDESLHEYDMEQVKRLGLEDDLELLFMHALASRDFLEYVWGKDHTTFFMDLMEQTMLLSEWNFENERLFLVPSLLKNRQSVGKRVGHCAVFDFSTKFLPMGVFQRLVCLCVNHSAMYRQQENGLQLEKPKLNKHETYVEVGPSLMLHLYEDLQKHTITLYMENDENAHEGVAIVDSILRKINGDVMGSRLKWEILVEDRSSSPEIKMLPYTEARLKKLFPWVGKDQKQLAGAVSLNIPNDMFS